MKPFFVRLGIFVVFIALIGVGVWYAVSHAEPTLGTYKVGRGNIVSSVNIPGMVSSDTSVDLSFQEPGQITAVDVKEGDTVTAGEVLASLDNSSLQANLSQANAALAEAQADEEKVVEGSTSDQIAVAQKAVDAAQVTVKNATTNLASVTAQQQTAVSNALSALLNTSITAIPSSGNSDSVSPIVTGTYADTAQGVYNITLYQGGVLQFSTSGLEQAGGSVSAHPVALGTGGLFIQFPTSPNVNDTWTITIPNTASSSFVGNENAYQAALSNQSTQVSAAQSQLSSAQAAVQQAQANLVQTQAGATTATLDAAKAAVLQAQAQVKNVQILVAHADLVAPFTGVVRNVVAKPGQVVSAGVAVISLISNGGTKFDAYAPETDVANVQQDAAASITLDAYGNETPFPGRVSAVDTAQTTVNGSPAYHVTLSFVQPDPRVRAGMTGNAVVATTERDNVVQIPSRLVLGSDGDTFVDVQMNGLITRRPITLGAMGDNGMVEVVSGLSAGDVISDF